MDSNNSNNRRNLNEHNPDYNSGYISGYNPEYNPGYNPDYRSYRPSSYRNKTVIAVVVAAIVFVALTAIIAVLAMKVINTDEGDTSKDNKEKLETTLPQKAQEEEETPAEGEGEEVPVEGEEETPAEEEVKETPEERVTMYIANVQNSVYFRSEPSESESNIMSTIPFGTAVVFLGNEDAVFARIEHNGKEGFVKRDYLSSKIPQKPVDNTVKSYKYVVDVENSVYLRKGPSNDSGYYTTIPVGTQVGFIEKTNATYSKVSYNGQIGYVTSKYLADSYHADYSSYMTVYNVKNSIYLRSQPSENEDNIICTIPVGSRVKYLDSGNGTFYRISWNGKVGYAKSAYLRW